MRLLPPEGVRGVDKVKIPRISYEDALLKMQSGHTTVRPQSSSDPSVKFVPLPFPLTYTSGSRRNLISSIKTCEQNMATERNFQRRSAAFPAANSSSAMTDQRSPSTSPLSSSQAQRMSAFDSHIPSNLYGDGNSPAANPWSIPPLPTAPITATRFAPPPPSTKMELTASPTLLRQTSNRPTVTRGTVSFSGKSLQPPVEYHGFIGNEGLTILDTPTGAQKIMRVALEAIHGKICDAVSGTLHRIDVEGCADPFTAGETYQGVSSGLVDRLQISVKRFFSDEWFSTGSIETIQPNGGNNDSMVHHRACLLTGTVHDSSSGCAALGLRCLFATDDAMIGMLFRDGVSSHIAYVADFLDCQPLSTVLSSIEERFPQAVVACAIVHIMKLVVRALQKLAVRRVTHGHLDNIHLWVVGFVASGTDTDIVLFPIGWDDAVDFRVFANSEVGNTIPLERPASRAVSANDNEEDEVAELPAFLHVGYDMCLAVPAIAQHIRLQAYINERGASALHDLSQWAGAGGHSPPEYSLKTSEVLGMLVPTIGDPRAFIPWQKLVS